MYLPIRIRRPINGHVFIRTEYLSLLFLNFKTCTISTTQKDLIPVVNCLLCCVNTWYSWGVIRSSHRIRTGSHRVRIVVKFYNYTLRLLYGCIPTLFFSIGASRMKTFIKNQCSSTNGGSL